MSDLLLILEVPESELRLAVVSARQLSLEAERRHALAEGSAGVLAQALAGALLLAATDRPDDPPGARVDVQVDCEGPLRGLLVDADGHGTVRGLVRENGLNREGRSLDELQGVSLRPSASRAPGERSRGHGVVTGSGAIAGVELQFMPPQPLSRFQARPLLGAASDRRAGTLSILRALPGIESLHRAVVPFAGGDLGVGLSAFLRAEHRLAGELGLEVLYQPREPLAAVAGAMLLPRREDQQGEVRALGERLRAGVLHEALLAGEAQSPGNAHALANRLATALRLGPVRLESELRPRFSCRCSRERVVLALQTLGGAELRDMAQKDGGAEASCDFCAETYRISAQELLELAGAA